MTRLNQIIAVEKGVKSRSLQELTEAHHALQKPAILSGITRSYRPRDEEGEQLPPESTKVQIKAEEIIRQTVEIMTRLFDVTATKDWANCRAAGPRDWRRFKSCIRREGVAVLNRMWYAPPERNSMHAALHMRKLFLWEGVLQSAFHRKVLR